MPLILAFLAGVLSLAVAQRYFPEALGADGPPRPRRPRSAPRAEVERPFQLSLEVAARLDRTGNPTERLSP